MLLLEEYTVTIILESPRFQKKLEDYIFYSVVEYIIKQLFEQTRPTRIQGQSPFAMSSHTT